MLKNEPQAARREAQARAFTLIELMVVIGIIALLVAISLPAYSTVRKRVKSTATQATLNVLDIGINSFRADSQLGGNYPISYRIPNCINPHDTTGSDTIPGLSGGELLAWAMVGADQLGTPGFKNVDGSNAIPMPNPAGGNDDIYGGWTSDSSSVYNPPPQLSGLYALYPPTAGSNANQPVFHRNMFVDLSKMKLPKATRASGVTSFTLPEFPKVPARKTICFLDSFGQPILYYRANRTASTMASWGNGNGATVIPPRGIYDLLDNGSFTGGILDPGDGSTTPVGLDFGGGTTHPLARFNEKDLTSAYPDATQPIPPKGCWQSTVQNLSISAKRQPYNEDKYIMLSAGSDGLYGTGDDIANFPLNQ